MLTDEELTRRLSAAFHEGVPELTYAGTVPQVRRRGTGLAATSVLAAAAALVLTPAALQRGADRPPSSVPSADPGVHDTGLQGHTVIRTSVASISPMHRWTEWGRSTTPSAPT